MRTGITNINIENFKGIGEKVTIPLKPITMLFGANSAGKSTVLQSLVIARTILEYGGWISGIDHCGAFLNWGSFYECVHNHDRDKKIVFEFEYQLDNGGLTVFDSEDRSSRFDANELMELKSVLVRIIIKGHGVFI